MLIEATELSKRYGCGAGQVTALDRVSLRIRQGEFLSVMGPSGSGKSTLLHLLSALDQPTSGCVRYDGADLGQLDDRALSALRRRRVGFIFQQFNLLPVLTARENILLPLLLDRRRPDSNRLEELAGPLGIADRLEHLPHELSGGQQQRVAIARALVAHPQVLLLDEPLGALDLKLRKDMQVELKKIQKQTGITFVFVTHDQEEALSMSDTVVVMSEGKIQQIGTPIDIYNEPQNAFVADFIGESNILDGIMLEDYKVAFSGQTFPCLDKDFGKNVPVDVVVRPEDVDIVPVEQGQLTGVVTSVTFMGVHYEIIVDVGGFKWMIQTTDFVDVDEHIGIQLEPDAIHIMRKSEYSDLYGDYSSFSNELDELSEAPEEDDE